LRGGSAYSAEAMRGLMRHGKAERKARLKAERKAEREAQGKKWVLDACFWGCLGAAFLLGLLGYLWHPLWGVALVFFTAWIVIWVLGWLGLLGWFVLDTFGFEIRRKRD
jgi:polyferredoxin